ncbi:helix-turn-helix transcriptional regulator [Candidatus Desantisbacteria bacterium]|nr:helix-turn-helix transcriptional regulator [Candidatus Desantisbacteria bacterium]
MDIDKKIYEMHAEMCKIFTNSKRLEILNILRDGEKSVTELEKATGLHQSNISQHLSLMRDKMIVETRRDGTNIYYSLADKRILKAFDIVREMLYAKIHKNAEFAQKLDEK